MRDYSLKTLVTVIKSVTCGREASSNGWLSFKVQGVCVCVWLCGGVMVVSLAQGLKVTC